MATLHATAAALRTLIEGVTPLTDAGRRFHVVPEGHVDDTPSSSREVVLWAEGVGEVTHLLSSTTWHVVHVMHVHVRYHATRLGTVERLQATEDAAILLGTLMRPVQLFTAPWAAVRLTGHEILEPSDERQWVDSVLHLDIYQEVS